MVHSSGSPEAATGLLHIGEAAERVGLSVRTIRHYEDVGLITPGARSTGGFRLYTDADLDRLLVAKDMKPLGFTLEEMREVLTILDSVSAAGGQADPALLANLHRVTEDAEQRIEALEKQLFTARRFADRLRTAASPSR